MDPRVVILAVVIAVLLLIVALSGRSSRGGRSTAGHYDPDAIGGYTLDPATMRYRYDLPTLPRGSAPTGRGSGAPRGRRRRRHATPRDEHLSE
jgi:hypothetical protein